MDRREMLLLLMCFFLNCVMGITHNNFTCDQLLCRWSLDVSNWTTAHYSHCMPAGGSLLSWKHKNHTNDWMRPMLPTADRVWTSLRMVNRRYQWQYQLPEYLTISANEWMPGHPVRGKDCVVTDSRNKYESVFCNSSYPAVCVLERVQGPQLDSLRLPETTTLKVKLELGGSNHTWINEIVRRNGRRNSFLNSFLKKLKKFFFAGKKKKELLENSSQSEFDFPMHFNIDRFQGTLMFALQCNVSGVQPGPRRYLELSWLKDGVFLNNRNQSLLKLKNVKDFSKTNSKGVYQRQGTFQCQVKEFGGLQTITSNSILVTYRQIYTGVVILLINQPIDADSVMEKMVKSVQELSKSVEFTAAWDQLYVFEGPKGVEYHYSFYVDFSSEDESPITQQILDAIIERVHDSGLHQSWGIDSASLTWATYCPQMDQELSPGLTIRWPSLWSSTEHLIECIQNNSTKTILNRQCLHDFTQGATINTPDFKQCHQIIGPLPNDRCLSGYQWLDSEDVCYLITPAGSWADALSPCFANYPSDNEMEWLNYPTLLSIAQKLQESGAVSDLWLPVRRPSIYGPSLYYPTTDDDTTSVRTSSELWKPDEEECQVLTMKDGVKTTNCSYTQLPSVCVYKKSSNFKQLENLCPAPWRGLRVYQNRLVCFNLVTLKSGIEWMEGDQICRNLQPDFAVNASMATFKDSTKAKLWELVRPSWKINSSWIGLRRSDEDTAQFCWHEDCQFEFFNWDLSEPIRKDDRYGVMRQTGSWSLLPSSERRNQVLCESTIDLSIHSEIQIQAKNYNTFRVEVMQSERWKSVQPKSFTNVSEFLAAGYQWINFQAPENRVRCYIDGKLFLVMKQLAQDVLVVSDSVKSFHCEGWIGWPRRFVRSQYVWTKRTSQSEIFLLTLSAVAEPFYDTQVVNDLRRKNINVHISYVTSWETSRQIFLRLEVETINSSRSEQEWLQLIRDNLSLQTNYKVVEVRSTVICPEVTEGQHTWKSTPIGQTAQPEQLICLTNDGHPALVRKCLSSPFLGAYWSAISTEVAGCKPPTELYLTLKNLTQKTLSGEIDSSIALDQLATLGKKCHHSFEITAAVHLLEACVQSAIDSAGFKNASQSLIFFMESEQKLLAAQSFPGVSSSLVTSLELMMGQVNLPDGEETFQHPKLVVESFDFQHVVGFSANVDTTISNSSRIMNNTSCEEWMAKDIVVLLPMEEIQQRIQSPRLSFSLLASAALIDANPVTRLPGDNTPQYVVGSPVIITQVGNTSISNLTQSVRILFRSSSDQQPVCVYWDKSVGGWSTRGCRYAGKIATDLHICECNHLTPLALLIPYSDFGNNLVLGWISIVGCIISMISLFLVMLTFLIFRQWRQSLGNKILFNLSASLFGLMCSFLAAGHLDSSEEGLCKVAAIFTHYFLLSSFSWMLVEAIYQYVAYVIIIGVQTYKSRFMRKAMPLAWGLPVLPIIGLFIYDSSMYIGQPNFCWMSLEAFYPAVLAPVTIVLLVNVIVYVLMLKSVVCIKLGLRTNQSNATRIWYQLRLSLCVFFLLGLAWIFGFLSIGRHDASLVFAYLFCIFNSFQGFAIFVFFVLRERNARKLWTDFVSVDTSGGFSVAKSSHTSSSQL